jgi:hypothetical protein
MSMARKSLISSHHLWRHWREAKHVHLLFFLLGCCSFDICVRVFGLGPLSAGCLHMEWDGMRMFIYVSCQGYHLSNCSTQYSVSHMFIKITWDEIGGRVGINRGRKAPYFTRHFDGFLHSFHGLALHGSMVSRTPSFITYPSQCMKLHVNVRRISTPRTFHKSGTKVNRCVCGE